MKNLQKNSLYKPFSAKIMLVCIVMLMAISMVSALEFDNIKSIKNTYGKAGYRDIEIINSFGLGKKLWSGTLDYNTETCGQHCEAIQTITLHEKGSLVDEVLFERIYEDGSRKQTNIRNYKVLIKTGEQPYEVDDYEYQCKDNGRTSCYTNLSLETGKTEEICGKALDCSNVKVGSHIEYNKLWKEYELGTELEAGTYEVKLEGEKKPSWTVDWIYKTQGETLNEWAVWGNIQSLITYLDFDENTGTIAYDKIGNNNLIINGNWTEGKYDSGVYYNGTGGGEFNSIEGFNVQNFTIEVWVNFTSLTAPETLFGYSGTGKGILMQVGGDKLRCYLGDGSDFNLYAEFSTIGLNEWHHIACSYNGTGVTVFYDGNYEDSSNEVITIDYSGITEAYLGRSIGGNTINGVIDEFKFWNESRSESEIQDDMNEGGLIILNSPQEDYLSVLNEVQFNATAIATGGTTLVNMSLWHNATGVWHRNQTKTITGTENTTTFNQTFIDGNYLWAIEACNSNGDCGFSENRTLKIFPIRVDSETYNNQTYETASETYSINVSIRDLSQLTEVNLIFEEVPYSAEQSENIWSRKIDIPIGTEDKSFYWNFIYGGESINSTIHNVTVE